MMADYTIPLVCRRLRSITRVARSESFDTNCGGVVHLHGHAR